MHGQPISFPYSYGFLILAMCCSKPIKSKNHFSTLFIFKFCTIEYPIILYHNFFVCVWVADRMLTRPFAKASVIGTNYCQDA